MCREAMNRTLNIVVVLLVLSVLPYVPGLRHGFVYDDHGAIVENAFFDDAAHVRDVLALRTMTNPRVLDGQRPTLLLSMFLDRGAGRLAPWRFHLTNVMLHAGVTVMFFFWLLGLLRTFEGPGAAPGRPATAAALVAAIMFALHPMLTEAVQLPSYREDLLFAFFLFGFLLAARARPPWLRWTLQAVTLLLAAGSKESIVVVPFVLGWQWWCFPNARPARRAAEGIMVLSVLLVAGYLALAYAARPLQAAAGIWNGLSLHWPQNVWTAPWLWVRYLALLVVPYPLSADRVVEPVVSPLAWRFLLGALALGACVALAWTLRRRAPLAALGLGWMLLAFAPVSNLLPLYNPMADRYAYLMVPGFALCAAWLFVGSARRGGSRTGARLGLALLAVTYVALIQLRLDDWRSDWALWSATARTEPYSARARAWLGVEAMNGGDLAEARRLFAEADAMNPQEVTSLINLAILDGSTGGLAQATAQLREAIRRRPDKAEAWANLAVALELQGHRQEALDAAEQASRLDLLGRSRHP